MEVSADGRVRSGSEVGDATHGGGAARERIVRRGAVAGSMSNALSADGALSTDPSTKGDPPAAFDADGPAVTVSGAEKPRPSALARSNQKSARVPSPTRSSKMDSAPEPRSLDAPQAMHKLVSDMGVAAEGAAAKMAEAVAQEAKGTQAAKNAAQAMADAAVQKATQLVDDAQAEVKSLSEESSNLVKKHSADAHATAKRAATLAAKSMVMTREAADAASARMHKSTSNKELIEAAFTSREMVDHALATVKVLQANTTASTKSILEESKACKDQATAAAVKIREQAAHTTLTVNAMATNLLKVGTEAASSIKAETVAVDMREGVTTAAAKMKTKSTEWAATAERAAGTVQAAGEDCAQQLAEVAARVKNSGEAEALTVGKAAEEALAALKKADSGWKADEEAAARLVSQSAAASRDKEAMAAEAEKAASSPSTASFATFFR